LSIKYWVRVLVLYAVYCVLHVAFDSTLGWAQTDAIAAERVQFVGPGGDIGRFPITAAISRVDVTLNGVEVQFDKRDGPKRWPNTCGRPLAGYNPKPGELVGLFVVAGDARNNFYRVQERSNIVTFPLPPSDTGVSFTFAADGGESIQDTLVRVRNTYPSLITADQAAAVLNETAYLHRTEGWALLGKSAGNNCGQPKTGTRISCDYLIQ